MPVSAPDATPDGPATALFRPGDVEIDADGLAGRVTDASYRGGIWEARVAVAGLPDPFEVAARSRISPGERLCVRPQRGWILPDV